MRTVAKFAIACVAAIAAIFAISALTGFFTHGPIPNEAAQLQIEQPSTEATEPEQAKAVATTQPVQPADTTVHPPKQDAPAGAINIAAGKKLFRKCKACHSATKDGKDKAGPNLWNTVNHPIASSEGFKYSPAMAGLNSETWTPEKLDAFLLSPKGVVKKTKMSFAGIKKQADRNNLIAWLAQQADEPISPEALGLATAGGGAAVAAAEGQTEEEEEQTVVYRDPPPATQAELTEIARRVGELEKSLPDLDYERARWHPIHFKPAISKASDAECLTCHAKVLERKPLDVAPAGIKAKDALAWYQTLDTYHGDQQTFHYRHIESPFAKQVMNLKCNFCHQGNDPREESPGDVTRGDGQDGAFALRKMVNPTQTCLRCHGQYDYELMGTGPWPEYRTDVEDEETPNGCLSCHGEAFRTNRHAVTYLKAASIEEAAKTSSDTCYGCHGGRAWYRNTYPYPRNPFPGMDEEIPVWAKDRPTQSEEQYRLSTK